MRPISALATLGLFALSIACGVQGQAPSRNESATPDVDAASAARVIDPELDTATFLQPYGDAEPVLVAGTSPEEAARAVLDQLSESIGIGDVSVEFEIENVSTDALGMTHVAFRQLAAGFPVFGMRYGVHFDKTGRVAYLSGRYAAGLNELELSTAIGAAQAVSSATEDLEKHSAPHALTQPLGSPSPRTVVFVLDNDPRLAYEFELAYSEERFVAMQYVVDATDGSILRRIPASRFKTVPGSGAGVLYHARNDHGDIKTFDVTDVSTQSTPRYQLIRPANSSEIEITVRDASNAVIESGDPNTWDATGPSAGQAVDGFYNLQVVDSYHQTTHARASFDGAGTAMSVFVHVPMAQDNAFYYNGGIYSGDIVASAPNAAYIACLDVVAHEFQHGVNNKTLNLVYQSQSGAIDEGLADIFGCLVEHHHAPHATNNTLIGEASTQPHSNPIRNVADPSSQGDPDHMDKYQDLPTDDANDLGGVHINSTIISHAWYLMTLGGTNATSGVKVTEPIGWSESEKLWNAVVEGRAQAPTAAFADFARVIIATAYQLESAGDSSQSQQSPVPVSQDGKVQAPPSPVRTVGCAWLAVGVLNAEELEEHWGIKCDGDASEGPELDCFTGGQKCGNDQVCSWNGSGNGYCCKAPWEGTKTCFTDKECAPGICARGKDNRFFCTEPDAEPCVESSAAGSGGSGGSGGSSGSGGSAGSAGSSGSGGQGGGDDPGCDGTAMHDWRHASLAPTLLLVGFAGAFRRRR